MNDRLEIVASLPTGPQEPVTGTPPRRRGCVRRTTSIEEHWDEPGRPRRIRATGRDLATGADGTAGACELVEVALVTDGADHVAELRTEPSLPELTGLVGVGIRSGFRAAAAALIPDHRDRYSLVHQLFDDVPMAALIAGYGLAREHPEWNIPPEVAAGMRDVCVGWVDSGTMIATLERTGIFPIPLGPPAPDLAVGPDPLAWHEQGPVQRRTVRRVRRLDLWRDGDGLVLEAYFRDSHLGEVGDGDVLHEYTVTAELEPSGPGPGDLRFLGIDAVAHTLPWPECPGALSSVQRLVGRSLAEVVDIVRDELTGASSCSHLNDVLRSTRAVTTMAPMLP